jgi:hypothetical protein
MKPAICGAVALVAALVQPASAGESVLVMALEPGQVPVAATMDVEAAYVVAPAYVECDERDGAKRGTKVASATKRIIEQGAAKPGVGIRQSVITLATGDRDSFSISKSYGGPAVSKVFVVSKLGEKEDIYSATVRIAELVNAIPKMDCISVRAGNAVLGLDNPERFRPQLLKLIADQVTASKSALRLGREVEVGGLERPVLAIQKNAREVTLFINYTLKIRQ